LKSQANLFDRDHDRLLLTFFEVVTELRPGSNAGHFLLLRNPKIFLVPRIVRHHHTAAGVGAGELRGGYDGR
jgi:hypothetical protein